MLLNNYWPPGQPVFAVMSLSVCLLVGRTGIIILLFIIQMTIVGDIVVDIH